MNKSLFAINFSFGVGQSAFSGVSLASLIALGVVAWFAFKK